MGKIEDKDIDLHIDRETLLQEYIPKDQYEARLKADMVAMLTEIQLEIQKKQECANTGNWNSDLFSSGVDYGLDTSCDIIQEKIDKLRGENNGNE